MNLDPQSIEAFKLILNNPAKYNLNFRPMNECIQKSYIVTPKHVLFNQFNEEVPQCPKLVFYIIMDELYKQGKATTGELGYFAEFIPK